jgi:hypothetical protein
MFSVADQGMDLRIRDPIIHATAGWAGEAIRVDPLGGTAPAFALAPGPDWWSDRGI